jgi:hypothetical protein
MARKYYWWIHTHDEQGKLYLIMGSERSESEAVEKARSMLPGLDFSIKRYPTRDVGTASQFARGKRLDNGEGLNKAKERIGHTKSLQRHIHQRSQKSVSWE